MECQQDKMRIWPLLSKITAVGVISIVFVLELFILEYVAICKVAVRLFDWHLGLTIPLAVIAFVVWTLALWAFLAASITEPGYLNESTRQAAMATNRRQDGGALLDPESTELFPVASEIRREFVPQMTQFCPKCNCNRPERAHHCSFCGRCVLRMDHHCPWVGNCVGLKNQRHFIQFGGYVTVASVIFACILIPIFALLLAEDSETSFKTIGVTYYIFLILGVGSVVVCGLAAVGTFAMQVKCVLKNVTAIEMSYQPPNPYDLGWRENWKQIFGPFSAAWFLPIPLRPRPCDGYLYRVNESALGTSCNASLTARMQISGKPLNTAVTKHSNSDESGPVMHDISLISTATGTLTSFQQRPEGSDVLWATAHDAGGDDTTGGIVV